MNSQSIKKKLASRRERRVRIDAEIKQLEAQLDAQERAGQGLLRAAEGPVREIHCRCARPGEELHGPYWNLYWKKNGKTKSRYVGKERTAVV